MIDNNNFKILYQNYLTENNEKTEDELFRNILFNYKFIVCQINTENGLVLDTYWENNNTKVLNIYTQENEIDKNKSLKSNKIEIDFDSIFELTNKYHINKVIINSLSDKLVIKNNQISSLYRQKEFGDRTAMIKLNRNIVEGKSAYKLRTLQPQSNKIIELYKKYMDTEDKKDLDNFYQELVYNAKFYSFVIPEDNAPTDKNGNPTINYTRVLHYSIDDNNPSSKYYDLELNPDIFKDTQKYDESYMAEFSFDDYIDMIDCYWDIIKEIRIYGELTLTIPVQTLFELKTQKDILASGVDAVIFQGGNTEKNNDNNDLTITKIKLQYTDGKGKLKAILSITFNNSLIINNAYVVVDEEKNNRFIAFPFIKKNDQIYNLAYPITDTFRTKIENKVFELFDRRETEFSENCLNLKCDITDCEITITDKIQNQFVSNVTFNNSFIVKGISAQFIGSKAMISYPYSTIVDGKKLFTVCFDTSEIGKELIDSLYNKYQQVISSNNTDQTQYITPEERRKKTNDILKNLGIDYNENLPFIESSPNVKLKSIDDICKRAITSLFSTQVACDINAGKYEESVTFFSKMLESYNLNTYLNSVEKRIFNGTYSNQDVINADWEYETYWAIVWALGLIDDISDASTICDCSRAISFVSESKSPEDFKNKCKLRNIEEILNMLDLYYSYNWATDEKRINPNTNIGNLNSSIVIERRRGLEWLISSENDWYDISLDT